MNDTKEVELREVQVTGNFRRHFDEGKLAELTASIKEFGVLEPILVRFHEDGYILIAGERRLRAADAAGLKKVPVRVLDVDEKAAAEIQLLENLHREDLTPLDEARALNTLLDQGKHTAETLAERVDKSVAYVYRAIKLLDLPEAGIQAIEDGKLTPAHGHQILRAPAEGREELVAFALGQAEHRVYPAWELRQHIDYQHAADLGAALFPKGKAFAGEMACNACPFNSGNQGQLFDGAEKGKCSNPVCFQKKTAHFTDEYSKGCAVDYPGLQYLGVHHTDYAGGLEGVKRGLVMSADLPREVAKLVKAQPEKFGWAVVAPRGAGDKLTSSLVCLDRRVLEKTDARPAPKGEAGATYAQQRFVEEEVTKALREAVAATVEGARFDFTPNQWDVLRNALAPWPDDLPSTTNRERAAQLLVRLALDGKHLELLGLDQDKIAERAAKAAEKRWKQEQAKVVD